MGAGAPLRSRGTLPAWTLLPLAVSCAGLRLLPHAPLAWALAAVLLARVVATLASARGERAFLPRPVLLSLWGLAFASLSVASVVVPLRTGDPLAWLVVAVDVFAALWLVGPQGPASRFFLLLASLVQTIAVAHARPDAAGLWQVLVYVASVVPALLAFERGSWTAARGGSERGLRRIEAVPRRALSAGAFGAAALRLAVVGLPIGAAAYVLAAPFARPSPPQAPDARDERGDATTPGPADGGRRPGREVVSGVEMGSSLTIASRIKQDTSPALGVRVLEGDRRAVEPIYLRTSVYDRFSGRTWTTSTTTRPRRVVDGDDGRTDAWIPLETSGRGPLWTLRIRDLRGSGQLALPRVPKDVQFDRPAEPPTSLRIDERSVRVEPPLEPGDAYEVRAWMRGPDARALASARSDASVAPAPALVEPPPESARLLELARGIVGAETSPAARAALLSDHLRAGYTYALDASGTDATRPIHDFLFRTRRGNCEHFASAMVLLLRALGHPARLAAGFRVPQDAWVALRDEYVVRASTAHAWVEMWYEGEGWVRYDPTAPDRTAVDAGPDTAFGEEGGDDLADRLLRFEHADRRALLARGWDAVRSVLAWPWTWAALALVVLAAVARRRASRRRVAFGPGHAAFADAYRRALRALEREGVHRRPMQTPTELLGVASRLVPGAAAAFARLTRRFEAERYGAAPRDRAAADAEAEAVVAAVRESGRRRRAT